MNDKPQWLIEFRRRTALIDAIEKAFDSNCQCEVCRKLREVAKELGELFLPQTSK
jgi:hypothetical protein